MPQLQSTTKNTKECARIESMNSIRKPFSTTSTTSKTDWKDIRQLIEDHAKAKALVKNFDPIAKSKAANPTPKRKKVREYQAKDLNKDVLVEEDNGTRAIFSTIAGLDAKMDAVNADEKPGIKAVLDDVLSETSVVETALQKLGIKSGADALALATDHIKTVTEALDVASRD